MMGEQTKNPVDAIQSFSVTFAILRRYGRTKENRMSPFLVNREALLGAFFDSIIFGALILQVELSIASISIYLKNAPLGVVDCIGARISPNLHQTQFSGMSNGISSLLIGARRFPPSRE